MAEYEIARFHSTITTGDITVALSEFTQRHGHLPHAIAVHPINRDAVAALVVGLSHQIPVTTNAGAWSTELWLQTNDTSKEKDNA